MLVEVYLPTFLPGVTNLSEGPFPCSNESPASLVANWAVSVHCNPEAQVCFPPKHTLDTY